MAKPRDRKPRRDSLESKKRERRTQLSPSVELAARSRRKPRRSVPSVEATLAAQPWEQLERPLIEAGASPSETIPLLRRYAAGVIEWNRSASNLISKNDEPRFVVRHLVESLVAARWLKSSSAKTWIDFGSGAGLPALPLVMAGVGDQWCLVESRRVKTLFLSKIIEDLDLRNVTVVRDRLENLVANPAYASCFDGFTARATMRLAPTLEMASALLKPGGAAFLWKGSGREEEMEESGRQHKWSLEGVIQVGETNTNISKLIYCK